MARAVLRGRASAMSAALAVLRRTGQQGRGGIVTITGEAGIGKTAVLNELVHQAAAIGFAAGVGKADEVGQISPGAPLLMALRSGAAPLITPDGLDQLLHGISEPLQLLEQITGRLEKIACASPVILALDDAHWADTLTRFVVRALPARLAGSPIVWVMAGRDSATGLVSDLSQAEIPQVPLSRIPLGPLADCDVHAIVRDRLGTALTDNIRSMLNGVGGNPFLVTQILESLARGEPDDQIPTEFVFSTRRRVQALGAGERRLVQIAAVLGRPFAVEDAAALLAEYPAASVWTFAETAVEAGLLTDRSHRIGFRHDLVRQSVYADLTDATRQDLHRRCARYLMATGKGPLTVAPHARASAAPGDVDSAMILDAAARAALTAMPDTAGDLALQAFGLLRPSQPAWADIGEHCVEILGRVQRCTEAVTVADLLLARAEEPETAARVQVHAARALWLMGRPGESLARLQAALSQPGLSPALRARLAAARALALTRTEPAQTARTAAEPALVQARSTGDAEAITMALQAVGEVAKNCGQHAESLTHFRELRIVGGHGHLAQEILALQMLDRFDQAETLLDAARTDARDQVEGILPSVLFAQLWQEFSLSRLAEAESTAETLIALSSELGNHTHGLQAMMIAGSVALLRGDVAEARARLAPVLIHADADDEIRLPGLHLLQGWIAAADGDLDAAIAILAPALYTARESRSSWPWWPGWMRGLTRIGLAAGDRRFAEHAVAVAEEGAARNPGVASFEGLALQLRGTLAQDLALVRRASQVLAHSPRPVLRATGYEDYGRTLLAAGQRKQAVVQLDLALDGYLAAGAGGLANALQQTMRGAGIRRSARVADLDRPRTGWAALTDAEMRVAHLVSAGQTNQDAARDLGLSPNTVGTHVRSIFAKLGVHSRVQLANAWHEHTAAQPLSMPDVASHRA